MPMLSADEILRRFELAKQMRTNWDNHWQEIARVIHPDAGDFNQTYSRGTKRTQDIFDSKPVFGLERFATALESLLTPRTELWHRIVPQFRQLNEEPGVRPWFEEVNDLLFAERLRPGAGYYSSVHSVFKQIGAFGSAPLFVDGHPRGGLEYRADQLSQIYVVNNPQGIADTFFRHYKLDRKQALQEFGDRMPRELRSKMEQHPYEQDEYLSLVLPREEGADPLRVDGLGMPFAAYEVSVSTRENVVESGFEELPYMFPRYSRNSCEAYGRSPAMLVLPDIHTRNEMMKTHLRAGHNAVDPPILTYDDGVVGFGARVPRMTPGAINYGGLDAQGRPLIQPYNTGNRPDLSVDLMREFGESIRDAFLETFFTLLVDTGREMTAFEVAQRAQEKGQLIGPVVGRLQEELLGPQIRRELGLLFRQGRLPPPPPVLLELGIPYDIEYESPATRLSKFERITGLPQWFNVMAPFLEQNPGLLDQIANPIEVGIGTWDILGLPKGWLVDAQERARIAEAQAQARAEEEMANRLPEQAAAALDAARALPALREANAA